MLTKIIKSLQLIVLTLVIVSGSSTSAYAIDLNFYRQNDILFYNGEDPCASDPTIDGCESFITNTPSNSPDSTPSTSYPADCNLVPGGMTFNQAKAFMSCYKTAADSVDYIGGSYRGCTAKGSMPANPLANCVSFSTYFINKYTSLKGFKDKNPGDGARLAWNIIDRNPTVNWGKTPKPYSIFSVGDRYNMDDAGHTGVVLGFSNNGNSMYIGEASCSRPLSWTDVHVYSVSNYNAAVYVYAGPFLN